MRRRSLYSCLADGKLCVLCSPPAGQEMLTAALLGEMEVFQKCRRDFCLIDYDVSCKTLESSSLLQTAPGQMLFIGSTFRGLGLANCVILPPTLCCLGVSALDANDIFKMVITNGIVHHVTVGLGHHAAFTFAGVQEPPIPPDRLLTANIHDGSALTAADAAYSIESAAGSEYYGSRLRFITSAEAQDDLTLVLSTSEAYECLPLLLDIPIIKSGTKDEVRWSILTRSR